FVRLDAGGAPVRPRVLPLDPVAVPAVLRAGPLLPEERARELVSQGPDGAGERAGDPGLLRALRYAGRAPRPDAVVLQDHRLRPTPAGRHAGAHRVARARHHDAAELDRAGGGRARPA